MERSDGQGMDPHATARVPHGVWGGRGLVKVLSDPFLDGGSTHSNSVRAGRGIGAINLGLLVQPS